jgi:metallo-beta-lactamase class B
MRRAARLDARDGEVIGFGGTELTVMTPRGHTRGSVSYLMSVIDGGQKLSVAIVNIGTVVIPLVGHLKYPRIADDYEQSFAKQRKLTPDIWVAGHASQYNIQEKWKAGSFVDPEGYKRAIAESEQAFRGRLAKERNQ